MMILARVTSFYVEAMSTSLSNVMIKLLNLGTENKRGFNIGWFIVTTGMITALPLIFEVRRIAYLAQLIYFS